MLLFSCVVAPRPAGNNKAVQQQMTVARIYEARENIIQVVFSESQRFYKIPGDADPAYLDLLKGSQKNKIPVLISRASEYSDIILSVKKVDAR